MPTIRSAWARLTDSLWFVPGIIVVAAVALAVVMIDLSTAVDASALARWPRVFGAGAEGSRSMLAAIASSMITVAGVTFSITIVAVTQASSQYTPRILRNFMRDRANQAVLGTFVGIFAYCLVVLRTVRGAEERSFVPSLAVLLGVLLAIVGVAVLIFFVHHIATTLQASEIISRIAKETVAVVDRLFPESSPDELEDAEAVRVIARVPAHAWRAVPSRATGYIQRADIAGMMRVARRAGIVLRLERPIGDFTVAGLPAIWYAPHPSAAARPAPASERAADRDKELSTCLVVDTYRTVDQDPAFGIRQLVDIALKAISPGVNDTTTAVTCIEYLGAILARLASRRIEIPPFREDGIVRVVSPRPTFESLLVLAYDELRQSADDNVSVLAGQIETLAVIGRAAQTPSRRAAVLRQLDRVQEAAAAVRSAYDRARLAGLAATARA